MLQAYPTLRHTYLECEESALAELLHAAVDAKNLPGMADIDASLLYFSDKVATSKAVALTGEGADEIFGGYPWFWRDDLLHSSTFPWSRDRSTLYDLLNPDFADALKLDEYAQKHYDESLAQVPRLDGENSVAARRREVTWLNIHWFGQTLLNRMEHMSAHAGLNARCPFADYRLVEYLYNVPWEFKAAGGISKGLLRDAFKDFLPPELLNRKKSPFPKTYNPAYTELLCAKLSRILEDGTSPILPLLNKDKLREILTTPHETSTPWFGQLMARPQLLAYLIQIDYWMRRYLT